MKLFALVIIIGIICKFTVFKWVANWLNSKSWQADFPHDDPCWGCNRGSCIEPIACPVITDWDGVSEVDNEQTF